MRNTIPTELKSENDRITQIWLSCEDSIENVVEKHASKEYKIYFRNRMERKKKLRKQGIIVN